MEKPHLPDTSEWATETVEWFEAWRDSPRTDDWDAPQWQYLFDTAVVHSLVYGANQFSYVAELGRRCAFMGLSFDPTPPQPKSEEVSPLDDIKTRYRRDGPVRKPKP